MSWFRARWLLPLGFASAHLLLAASELYSAHNPRAQRRDLPLAPPSHLHWVDGEGRFHWRPFIYPWQPLGEQPGSYREDSSRPHPVQLFAPAPGNRLWGWLPCPIRLVDSSPPGELFLLGTDELGRDLWSRFLHGGRLSLLTALLSAVLALGLGSLGGLLAGYASGWVDRTVVWCAQLCLSLPWIYLLLAVRGALPLDLPASTAWVVVSLIVGFAGWGRTGLLVRSAVAGTRHQGSVLAAVGLGLAPWQVLSRHVLPAIYGLLLTQAALLVPRFVIAEVTLSFLGVGISEPQPSWGNLLAALTRLDEWRGHPWLLAPAVGLVLLILGYQAVADRLSDKRGAQ